MTLPDIETVSEPSSRVWTYDWTPDLLRTAELLADAGDMRMMSDLCSCILGDDRVDGALTVLSGAITGLPMSFEGSPDKRGSRKAIKFLEASEDWWKIFPESEVQRLIHYGVTCGFAFARNQWREDPETGRVIGPIDVWDPSHFGYESDADQWVRRLANGQREPVDLASGEWLFFAPRGRKRPWRRGTWRAVARWWLLKRYAIADWGAFSERHGQGTLVAQTQAPMYNVAGPLAPGGATAGNTSEARRKIAADLQALGRNSAIALPAGWTMELVEATADTWQTFQAQVQMADAGIALAFHGTNMTAEQGGSYAKALVLHGVHVQVVASLAQALSTTTHDDNLAFWAEFNVGSRTAAPWAVWDASPPADRKGDADAMGALGTACETLMRVSPRVDVERILEDAGVPLLEAAPAPAPAPAPQPAPATPAPAPAQGARGEIGGSMPPVGGELQPATPAAAAAAKRRIVPGFMRGQLYADDIVDAATEAATDAGADILSRVLRAIDTARGYEALRAELKSILEGADPATTSLVVERAMLLAELGGRLSVNEDVA
jgi:phage gp29-like protein